MSTSPTVRRSGFTLAELIIVMMIIVLLLSILLPALNSARLRAKKVASQAQLTALSTACNSYMLAFSAAPGYIATTDFMYHASFRSTWSGNRNLVVSLLGKVVPTAQATTPLDPHGILASKYGGLKIDQNAVGTGPQSASGRSYGAFYSPKPNELMTVTGTYEGDANTFPQLVATDSGMPILYARHSQKATATLIADVGRAAGNSNGFYYHSEITDSVMAPALSSDGDTYNQTNNSVLSFDVAGATDWIGNLAFLVNDPSSSTNLGSPNSLTNNVPSPNYVLMSAGPDGIYFDKAQIGATKLTTTNVSLADDLIIRQ
jgi:prepilin-type N-terminal cleavage/methylation domain-containing protein